MKRRRVIAALVLALAALPAAAGATAYAPVNRPGPKLSVPPAKLAGALACDGPLAGAAHPPVLLVPGTTLNPTTDFSDGWEPARLSRLHDRSARQRDGRYPDGRRVRRLCDPHDARRLRRADRHHRPFPGRHGAAVGAALLARYGAELRPRRVLVAARLGGAITNVAIQTVCPTDPTEHIGIGIYDNTAYALAVGAITLPGRPTPVASRAPSAWTR